MTTTKVGTANHPLAIQVDTREPLWVQVLPFSADAHAAPLPAGDILGFCSDGVPVLIERKTVPDLLGSIADGRLLTQVAGMLKTTPWCYLLITGTAVPGRNGQVIHDGPHDTAFTWASLQGALLTVQELGCGVVWATGDEDVVYVCERLFARNRGLVPLNKRDSGYFSPPMTVLMGLPGIGIKRASDLLQQHGSAARALCALLSRDKQPGIGPNTSRILRQHMGLRPTETLAVLHHEPRPTPERNTRARIDHQPHR
jgi:ERCC4-type nuclease